MKHLHYDDSGFFIFLISISLNLYYPSKFIYECDVYHMYSNDGIWCCYEDTKMEKE